MLLYDGAKKEIIQKKSKLSSINFPGKIQLENFRPYFDFSAKSSTK